MTVFADWMGALRNLRGCQNRLDGLWDELPRLSKAQQVEAAGRLDAALTSMTRAVEILREAGGVEISHGHVTASPPSRYKAGSPTLSERMARRTEAPAPPARPKTDKPTDTEHLINPHG